MRHYDQPSTPLERVLKSQGKTLPQIQGLKSLGKTPTLLNCHIISISSSTLFTL